MQKKLNELLKYLQAQNKPQTSSEIAEALSISVRSVKNHVKEINSLYDRKIILSSRNGYLINSQISPTLIVDDREESIPQTWEERAFYINELPRSRATGYQRISPLHIIPQT